MRTDPRETFCTPLRSYKRAHTLIPVHTVRRFGQGYPDLTSSPLHASKRFISSPPSRSLDSAGPFTPSPNHPWAPPSETPLSCGCAKRYRAATRRGCRQHRLVEGLRFVCCADSRPTWCLLLLYSNVLSLRLTASLNSTEQRCGGCHGGQASKYIRYRGTHRNPSAAIVLRRRDDQHVAARITRPDEIAGSRRLHERIGLDFVGLSIGADRASLRCAGGFFEPDKRWPQARLHAWSEELRCVQAGFSEPILTHAGEHITIHASAHPLSQLICRRWGRLGHGVREHRGAIVVRSASCLFIPCEDVELSDLSPRWLRDLKAHLHP